MKVIVTGANGQLGMDLVKLLKEYSKAEVFGFGRNELDITNLDQVTEVFGNIQPDVVIHGAAYTKVDQAEVEPDQAFLVNAVGTRNIAMASEKHQAKLVYISTDYVFDGTYKNPIHEFEATNPVSVYGKSKLAGENFVKEFHSKFFVVRTSWVYGENGSNFVKTMLQLGREKDKLSVVNDQFGCPTYSVDLVEAIINLIGTEKYGVYHISNSGECSWYEFAKAIFEEANISIDLAPCTTEDFPRPAPRPKYSVFDHMSLRINGFAEMRNWKESLKIFLKNYNR